MDFNKILEREATLDPQDWPGMRELAHRMVDDMFGYLEHVREHKVWQETPIEVINELSQPLPKQPQDINGVYEDFKRDVLPYNKGNAHPRFWGWVIGTGSPFGMMAEMLAAGLNPDICMGGHAPMYVEDQVIKWLKQVMNFPADASGILLSGTSMANLTGLLVARDHCTNQSVREDGLKAYPEKLVLYASNETHSCINKAADVIGLGRNAVRMIAVGDDYRIDVKELERQIEEDKKAGFKPFCVVANAGTVNTGAIDPIGELSEICRRHQLWLHVDGAFGAFAGLAPEYAQLKKDLGKADSVGFDLHKWMSLPMGVGCLLVKDRNAHRKAFSIYPDYLEVAERGIVKGPEPTFNYGIEMTKNFRALRVWMSIKEHGIEKFSYIIRQNIAQAFYLENLIKTKYDELEILTPVTLNIVCFRYNPGNGMSEKKLNRLNKEIMMELQESGRAAVSHTILKGKYVLRMANINHRSRKEDFHFLADEVVSIGRSTTGTIA